MTARLIALGMVCVFLTAAVAFALEPGGPNAEVSQPVQAAEPKAPPQSPPAIVPPPPPPPAAPNRLDCSAIRGTSYLSNEERDWYRANCLGH